MLMTVKEYAQKVGLGDKAVYRAIKEGRLSCVKKYGRILVDYRPKNEELVK
jgi:excisionase family DNA binding protein